MILFASTNKGKTKEVQLYAKRYDRKVLSIPEYRKEFALADPPEIVEDAETYIGNATKKASGYSSWARGAVVLADDSGLEVEALGGAPGLYTARYAGESCTELDNIQKLKEALLDVTERRARFCCSLVLVSPDGLIKAEGFLNGSIGQVESGGGGFGYDPIFIPDNYSQTLSELKALDVPIETHRMKALKSLFEQLQQKRI